MGLIRILLVVGVVFFIRKIIQNYFKLKDLEKEVVKLKSAPQEKPRFEENLNNKKEDIEL